MSPVSPVSRSRRASVVAALVALLALAGCTSGQAGVPGLREEASEAFVSGDSTVQVLPADERGEPVVGLAGATVAGEQLDVTDLRGGLVVLNVWGSWCDPCHVEAPDLVQAEAELADGVGPEATDVQFVGINVRDPSVEAAAGFEEEYGIDWPSLYDPDSLLLLTLTGSLPPNAVPATLVLDEEGRVAARIVGRVERATLVGVVDEVAAGGGAA